MISFSLTLSLQSLTAYSEKVKQKSCDLHLFHNGLFPLFFTLLFTFRRQILSFQFCKGHVSVNVRRQKCKFGAVAFSDVVQNDPGCCKLKLVSRCWKPITNRAGLCLFGASPWISPRGQKFRVQVGRATKKKKKNLEFPCLPDGFPRLLWIIVRPLCCLTSFIQTTCSLSPCFVGNCYTHFIFFRTW